jgi:hypothetical protein
MQDGMAASRGLFDGFIGNRSATGEDDGRLLREGLIVPDTKVLLNLYRYTPGTR